MNANNFDLRGQLGRLLTGALSLDAFRQWFAKALWAAESDADDDTLNLAYLVENPIAELSGCHITEEQLIDAFRKDFEREYGMRPNGNLFSAGFRSRITITTGTMSKVIRLPIFVDEQSAGQRSVVVSA
jgi:hypothetical protein